ncbi:MAG TPA: hypothetical protein VF595_15880 [Tepidisphaeraceae bacterium]|jgi:hypothetical protein
MYKLVSASVVACMINIAMAADVARTYTDGTLTVEGTLQGEVWTGKFVLNGVEYPATAEGEDDGTVTGTFRSGSHEFPFTGLLKGDTLTLITGGRTYWLRAKTAAAPPAKPNPLGDGGPAVAAPDGNGDGNGVAPAGYAVVRRTEAGMALTAAKADADTVRRALIAALTDITPLFDARPVAGGAYEDAKGRRSGGATFTATLKGKPMRGLVTAQLADRGANVAVLFAKADATADDIRALSMPAKDAAAEPVAKAPAKPRTAEEIAAAVDAVRLTQYDFPDGTGSTGVAEGWTTNTQSALDCNYIQGPAGQHIAVGANYQIASPDSPLGRAGMPGVLVAAFDEPVAALTDLVPKLSAMSARAGGASMRLDKIIDSQPVPSAQPGQRSAIVNYLITHQTGDRIVQTRNNAKIVCSPPGQVGMWMFYMVEIAAPVETWDQDVPTMLAMMKSRRENAAVCQQVDLQRQNAIRAQGAASQARLNAQFEAGQARHRAQVASFDAYNRQIAVNQNRIARSNDNFIELMRGYRTVVDTQTNTKFDADLTNVDGLVNGLNANDPGRFVQVPFRDEMNPTVQP